MSSLDFITMASSYRSLEISCWAVSSNSIKVWILVSWASYFSDLGSAYLKLGSELLLSFSATLSSNCLIFSLIYSNLVCSLTVSSSYCWIITRNSLVFSLATASWDSLSSKALLSLLLVSFKLSYFARSYCSLSLPIESFSESRLVSSSLSCSNFVIRDI